MTLQSNRSVLSCHGHCVWSCEPGEEKDRESPVYTRQDSNQKLDRLEKKSVYLRSFLCFISYSDCFPCWTEAFPSFQTPSTCQRLSTTLWMKTKLRVLLNTSGGQIPLKPITSRQNRLLPITMQRGEASLRETFASLWSIWYMLLTPMWYLIFKNTSKKAFSKV